MYLILFWLYLNLPEWWEGEEESRVAAQMRASQS